MIIELEKKENGKFFSGIAKSSDYLYVSFLINPIAWPGRRSVRILLKVRKIGASIPSLLAAYDNVN